MEHFIRTLLDPVILGTIIIVCLSLVAAFMFVVFLWDDLDQPF